ncbi:MAG: hypothetical protein J6J36_06675 [Clostridia bacterium]|nr:hypothetical protein [Clostridia bacterium]
MKLIKIGTKKIDDKIKEFAFDGCHKIYLITSEEGRADLLNNGWVETDFRPIDELEETFYNSCGLRFINLDRTKDFATIVPQCASTVTFTYLDSYGCKIKHQLNFN